MKYKMYGIPNCNSIKKAKDWLNAKEISFDFHDYKKRGVSEEKLDKWLSQTTWDKLVNKAGTTWKGLSQEEKELVIDVDTAKQLMMTKTSVIKRPVIEDNEGKIVTIGYNDSDYEHIFADR
jgi:arsenate reductase